MQATARQLGQNLRMPGFRKGKVPPPVVIQRIGRESVLDETVRGAMGRWYLDAIDAAGIHPVGDPDLDVGDLPGEGQPLTFTIEIGVRPTATLGEYKGVEVGKREAGADDAAVDAELEALRERSARLETAEGAAAGERRLRGHGLRRLHRRRELRRRRGARPARRAGLRAPGARLRGAARGREGRRRARRSPSTSPTTTARPSWRARRRSSRSPSRRSSARTCPRSTTTSPPTRPASTRWPSCARTSPPSCARPTSRAWRPSSARPCSTPSCATRRSTCRRRWSTRAPRSCGSACCTRSATRASTRRPTCGSPGRDEADILEEAKPDAEQALRREAVIAAVIEAEGIEPSEGDILDALQTTRGARAHDAREAARPAREGRAARRPARGPRPARRDRPAGRERDSDIRRAGPGA